MNDYIARVSERLAKTYAHEPEYLQCEIGRAHV